MASYTGTIQKRLASNVNETWENVYHLVTTDFDAAETALIAIKEAEKAVSYESVTFFRYIIKPDTPGSNAYIVEIDETGDLDPTGLGAQLPLFNTVLVKFLDVNGRPEKKYLRTGFYADNIETFGLLSGEYKDFVQTNYANVVALITAYVGPTGEAHTGAQVARPVQMRQLHWSRRQRPGFKRGWVPV